MTLPQGASFVNPAAGRLLLNPSQTAPQVQLTIARLVLNRQALFRPHARHWARPLLQLVFDSLSDPLRAGADGEHCLHYLARDLLTLVCSWPADALPVEISDTDDRINYDQAAVLRRAVGKHEKDAQTAPSSPKQFLNCTKRHLNAP